MTKLPEVVETGLLLRTSRTPGNVQMRHGAGRCYWCGSSSDQVFRLQGHRAWTFCSKVCRTQFKRLYG